MKHVIGPQGMISVAGETQVVVEGGPLFVNGVDVGQTLEKILLRLSEIDKAASQGNRLESSPETEDMDRALEKIVADKPAKKTSRKSED